MARFARDVFAQALGTFLAGVLGFVVAKSVGLLGDLNWGSVLAVAVIGFSVAGIALTLIDRRGTLTRIEEQEDKLAATYFAKTLAEHLDKEFGESWGEPK
ncbi:MAG TPA: hypothetical protein VHS74_10475 [Solirubrobacterales bacterium]|nr:hypothetical protein [Solirubrobacterales bacterium]